MSNPLTPPRLDPAVESAIFEEEDRRITITEVNAVLAKHGRVMIPSLVISGDGKFSFAISFPKKPSQIKI